MFEDLKDCELEPYCIDENDVPHFADERIERDPFLYIERALYISYLDDYYDWSDYLYLLSKYKMLYDNWFHGDN